MVPMASLAGSGYGGCFPRLDVLGWRGGIVRQYGGLENARISRWGTAARRYVTIWYCDPCPSFKPTRAYTSLGLQNLAKSLSHMLPTCPPGIVVKAPGMWDSPQRIIITNTGTPLPGESLEPDNEVLSVLLILVLQDISRCNFQLPRLRR